MLLSPLLLLLQEKKLSDQARLRACLMVDLLPWFYVLPFRWGMFRNFINSTAHKVNTGLMIAIPRGFVQMGFLAFSGLKILYTGGEVTMDVIFCALISVSKLGSGTQLPKNKKLYLRISRWIARNVILRCMSSRLRHCMVKW